MLDNQPKEIMIESPSYADSGINTKTAFFRQSAILPFVIGAALERIDPEGPISIISAGCSSGAEAYSMIAWLTRAENYTGKISLTGVDINQHALDQASGGRYVTVANNDSRECLEIRLACERFGIEVIGQRNVPGEGKQYMLDAKPLGDPHDVAFLNGDIIAEEVCPEGSADIVVANNVTYRLLIQDEERSFEASSNLAKTLKKGGVLSFGENGYGVVMGEYGLDRYAEWRWKNAEMLTDTHGLTPILVSSVGAAIVFANDA